MTAASSSSVTVTAEHIVHAAHPSSWQSLPSPFPLGPMDHYVTISIPVQVVFVYRRPSSSSSEELIPVAWLKRALERLLDYYPHLTGRLEVHPTTGERSITRLGSGMGLYEAVCSDPLDAFVSSALPSGISLQQLPGSGNALLAPFNPAFQAVCNDPLFAVQHTRFACGGVSLGVRVLHTIADADGFFQLVRDLAEIYRGLLEAEKTGNPTSAVPVLAQMPHFKPYMSELMGGNMTTEEQQTALAYKPSLFHIEEDGKTASEGQAMPETMAEIGDKVTMAPEAPTTGHFLRYTGNELQDLKDRATDPSGKGWVSTFEALSAHFYQCVHRARVELRAKDPSFGDISPTDFLTSVNLRTALGPDLPPRYFPQAVFAPWVFIPPEILADGPLWKVAKYAHDMMRGPAAGSRDSINGTLRWIAAQPNKSKIQSGFRFGSGSFMISQWSKTDMYSGATFDTRPILVSPPFTAISLVDALLYTLPTEDQGTPNDTGDIDVAVALSAPLWQFLVQDGRYMGGRIID
ncbi:hypothetical protein CALCODRAFT_494674 [Calocera cornea HHB12733]|uniref:Transferase-domain-containing protein n=1 Tax=Calocera cornea HHB12733 TaxID=1353952 RepID=A0A165GWL7_9BASI|nr:hypothetical protein CALCODRAFT_494674 [Calocera cornea HHB12733]